MAVPGASPKILEAHQESPTPRGRPTCSATSQSSTSGHPRPRATNARAPARAALLTPRGHTASPSSAPEVHVIRGALRGEHRCVVAAYGVHGVVAQPWRRVDATDGTRTDSPLDSLYKPSQTPPRRTRTRTRHPSTSRRRRRAGRAATSGRSETSSARATASRSSANPSSIPSSGSPRRRGRPRRAHRRRPHRHRRRPAERVLPDRSIHSDFDGAFSVRAVPAQLVWAFGDGARPGRTRGDQRRQGNASGRGGVGRAAQFTGDVGGDRIDLGVDVDAIDHTAPACVAATKSGKIPRDGDAAGGEARAARDSRARRQ